MKTCTGTPTRVSSRNNSIFFSYNRPPVAKIKIYLINFIRSYMGEHRKIQVLKVQTLSRKIILTGSQSYEKITAGFLPRGGGGQGARIPEIWSENNKKLT